MASRKNLSRGSSDSLILSKKRKIENETLEDCISGLPDGFLIQMLSLLPTKDAVASSLLSKRWRNLWTPIHSFYFSNANYIDVRKFKSFVDNALIHSTSTEIKKFVLDLRTILWQPELWRSGSKISQWIDFAVGKEVQDVAIYAQPYSSHFSYELPLSMYTCSSLITLTLTNWVFHKRLNIAWNSLKSLTLHSTSLDDDDIVKLLSSCPALEAMELSSCEKLRSLKITSNLKRLTLSNHLLPDVQGNEVLEIDAPHLKHLDISGDLGELKCRLVNVSSLVVASLTFSDMCITVGKRESEIDEDECPSYHQVTRNLVLDYLEKLSNVTELIIGSWFAEVVFMLRLESVILPRLRCKCLTLKLGVSKSNMYGIASLLQKLPRLESLNVHIKSEIYNDSSCEHVQSYLDKVNDINFWRWIQNPLFPNLKNVKIVGCVGECIRMWSTMGFCKLFKFLKFLLKNAKALQKLVIVAERRTCIFCSESCVSRHLLKLAEKMLSTPRSSGNLVISYQEIA
ncbi:F-box protein At5g03100-like [Solanum pennellii]|uniref:F-box protein At5g03100-like n=1 Tax=Solanum pennellii TaxID=28526 RepID=A0ABM1GLX3_SOLPN|nr:F-box protein At5g03100-like [Solanum pennellii]